VLIGCGLLADLLEHASRATDAHRYALIADQNVADHYGGAALASLRSAGAQADLFAFPPGEASKSRSQWARLSDALVDAGIGRDGAVVALGGGVTGDLAGFVAATYMRGIPVVHVPTSLLAMVDASVGGKTAVDVPGGKNLIGAFHAPSLVLVDPETIRSLPVSGRAEGLVEAVKHGLILDAAYLARVQDRVDEVLNGEPSAVQEVVEGSVAIKARVVGKDEKEAGFRQVLNFGHTLGHGLESASGFTLGHGAAVSLGMVLEARLGERIGVTRRGTADRIAEVLSRMGMPVTVPSGLDAEAVLAHVARDKKARSGSPRYVLLHSPGVVAEGEGWSREVPAEDVLAILV
jgi:3-dehydroquinate synthase